MNNLKIDLHSHTCCSDGNQSPLRLIKRAHKLGIDVLSITDHNSINGYLLLQKQILSCIKEKNILKLHNIFRDTRIIKGIELITTYKENMIDILGYNFDIKKIQRNLVKLYKGLPPKREILKQGILENIEKNKLVFNKSVLDNPPIIYLAFYNELKTHKENGYITHNIYTPKQFLVQHLNNPSSPLYVDTTMCYPNIFDTISCIQKSEGLAFIAHVGRYSKRIKYELDNIICCGLDGIEVWYPWHNNELQEFLLNKIEKYRLKASGGSDNHYIKEKEKCFSLGNMSIPDIDATKWIKDTINIENDFLASFSKTKKWLSLP